MDTLKEWAISHLMAWVVRHEKFDIVKTIDCETCGGAGIVFGLTENDKDETCSDCEGAKQYQVVYLRRWYLFKSRFFNVMLHNIRRSDDDPDPHDHPWSFVSLILKNGYIDESYRFDSANPRKPIETGSGAEIRRADGWKYEQRAGYFQREKNSNGKTEPVPHYSPWMNSSAGERHGPFNSEVKPGRLVYRHASHIHRVVLHKGAAWTLVFARGDSRPWGFITDSAWVYWRKYLNAWDHNHV